MTSIALTIAGSDSGGGAGIQADLKTFSALGVYGTSAITAVTAQNTQGVSAIHPVPADIIVAQIADVLDDFDVGAIKIGMVPSTPIILAIADVLSKAGDIPIVLDPVMVATSGDRLMDEEAKSALIEHLFPLASLVTPNLHEAAILANKAPALTDAEIENQAQAIIALGARKLLLKGGHRTGDKARDHARSDREAYWLTAERVATENTHGTGCTLSSAIAAHLARGENLRVATQKGKDYVTEALQAADNLAVGKGHGPTHHFHAFR